jgi:hypothetical protein
MAPALLILAAGCDASGRSSGIEPSVLPPPTESVSQPAPSSQPVTATTTPPRGQRVLEEVAAVPGDVGRTVGKIFTDPSGTRGASEAVQKKLDEVDIESFNTAVRALTETTDLIRERIAAMPPDAAMTLNQRVDGMLKSTDESVAESRALIAEARGTMRDLAGPATIVLWLTVGLLVLLVISVSVRLLRRRNVR